MQHVCQTMSNKTPQKYIKLSLHKPFKSKYMFEEARFPALSFAECTFNTKEAQLDFGSGAKWLKSNMLESICGAALVGAPVSQAAPRSIRNDIHADFKVSSLLCRIKKEAK